MSISIYVLYKYNNNQQSSYISIINNMYKRRKIDYCIHFFSLPYPLFYFISITYCLNEEE